MSTSPIAQVNNAEATTQVTLIHLQTQTTIPTVLPVNLSPVLINVNNTLTHTTTKKRRNRSKLTVKKSGTGNSKRRCNREVLRHLGKNSLKKHLTQDDVFISSIPDSRKDSVPKTNVVCSPHLLNNSNADPSILTPKHTVSKIH
jgi:hypothetical protein